MPLFPDPDETLALMQTLTQLLEDQHPGLISWCEARNRAARELRDHLSRRLDHAATGGTDCGGAPDCPWCAAQFPTNTAAHFSEGTD